MAQEQIELEFRNELQQLQAMQMQNPMMAQNPQAQQQLMQLTQQIEAKKSSVDCRNDG